MSIKIAATCLCFDSKFCNWLVSDRIDSWVDNCGLKPLIREDVVNNNNVDNAFQKVRGGPSWDILFI